MAVTAYGQYTISIVDDGVGIKSKQDYYTLSNQKDSLDGAKSYFEKEASGAIASFSDGAEDAPMGVVVDIDPVQDLNGYENPWPGGGGKNKMSVNSISLGGNEPRTKRFEIEPIPAGTYVISFTNGGTATSGFGLQFFDAKTLGNNVGQVAVSGQSFVLSDTAVSVYVYMGSTDYNNGLTFIPENIQIESGSTATDYAPYSNVCPISGRTGAKVTRTGRNLIELSFNQVNVSNILSNVFEMKAGTYTLSFNYNGTPTWGVYLRNGTTASSPVIKQAYNANNLTFTLDKDYQELCISVYYANGISVSEVTNAQIEKGSTATAYEPYTAVTHEIPFSTEVYGGTLNVETGELKITSMLEVFDTLTNNATISSQMNEFNRTNGSVGTIGDYTRISFSVKSSVDQSVYNRISSTYSQTNRKCSLVKHYFAYNEQSAHWYRNTVLYLFLPTALVGSTAEGVFNYLVSIKDTTPLSVMVELATPITLTLTPAEIRSLLGDNNVWADTGNVDVKYINEQDLTWETEPLVPNEEGKYLWWKYKITKDDDSTWESDPAVIGMFSDSDRVLANIEKAQNTADFAQGAAQMAQSSANYAQDAADRAQQSANNAQSSADQANEGVTNLRSEVASNYVTIADFSVSNESIQSSVTEVRTIAEAAQLSADTNYSDLSGNLEDLEGRVSTNETSISSIVTATSNLEQRADSINLTVEEHTREIEELQGYTTGLKATMNLTASGLDISGGDTTANTKVHINGDGVSIMDGDNVPAYFHGQDSKMINVEVTELLRIGNHKLLARSGGTNTTVVYVGDD